MPEILEKGPISKPQKPEAEVELEEKPSVLEKYENKPEFQEFLKGKENLHKFFMELFNRFHPIRFHSGYSQVKWKLECTD